MCIQGVVISITLERFGWALDRGTGGLEVRSRLLPWCLGKRRHNANISIAARDRWRESIDLLDSTYRLELTSVLERDVQ